MHILYIRPALGNGVYGAGWLYGGYNFAVRPEHKQSFVLPVNISNKSSLFPIFLEIYL